MEIHLSLFESKVNIYQLLFSTIGAVNWLNTLVLKHETQTHITDYLDINMFNKVNESFKSATNCSVIYQRKRLER